MASEYKRLTLDENNLVQMHEGNQGSSPHEYLKSPLGHSDYANPTSSTA
jgi:hypothetical protein